MAHLIKPLPFRLDALKGISETTNKWHHDVHYAGYVRKRNEIEEKLKSIDKDDISANYSQFGELKRKETFNASGQILHEIYWEVLGGKGEIDKSLKIVQKIEKDFGSFENWKKDFIATAKAALGWAICVYDFSDGKIHNFLADSHDKGGVWGTYPLIALDVFEHAYYYDYGPEKAKYIENYLKNINWRKVEERYLKLSF